LSVYCRLKGGFVQPVCDVKLRLHHGELPSSG
jgi:hypothetical protein